jgi:hypothetical protein
VNGGLSRPRWPWEHPEPPKVASPPPSPPKPAQAAREPFKPRYPGDACRGPIGRGIANEPSHPCPACGRLSRLWHRSSCDGFRPEPARGARRAKARTLAPWGNVPGVRYPRCEKCHRAIVRGKHRCRPLGRSHRHPETTDTVPPSMTSPIAIPPLLPYPHEGVRFNCKVSSELNLSAWSWRGRRARSKDQRQKTRAALAPYQPPALPVDVLVERTGWNALDEHDNLRLAAKSVIDAIAEYLGADDRDQRITWNYSQIVTREREIVVTRKGPVSQSVNRLRICISAR